MTIMNNKNKAIQFSYSNTIRENIEQAALCNVSTYTPELPVVTCSNKSDAEYIQQKVNTFIKDLSQEILEL